MDTTIYLNNQLSAEEAAIKIQEEAIRAKKAALRIKKTVDNKLKNTIMFLYDITTNYPEYKNIIAEELKDLLGINSVQSEVIKELEAAPESEIIQELETNPQSEVIQKSEIIPQPETIYSCGDKVDLGALSYGENYQSYIIEEDMESEEKRYNIFSYSKNGAGESSIASIEKKYLTLLEKTNPTTEGMIPEWIKIHILNSRSNQELQKNWNCLSIELKEKIKYSMGPTQHNQFLCIKALPMPVKGREPVQEGDEIIYRNPETQEEETAYYIGYYLRGQLLENEEYRSIYLPSINKGVACERRLLTPTGRS
ncbi:hypothetical protein VV11_021515, partial [Trichodesmium erythraeum 21-75]|nr:hypothetical protein [Trichodesmium erythraeum 21-75]